MHLDTDLRFCYFCDLHRYEISKNIDEYKFNMNNQNTYFIFSHLLSDENIYDVL